jgi:hypothetical protein
LNGAGDWATVRVSSSGEIVAGRPCCASQVIRGGRIKGKGQTGGTSYPRSNAGWALAISLDIEWAHAIAPGAKVLLVEASSNSFTNLLAAEDYAKTHAH